MSADAMAKEREEADPRGTTSSQASEAGSCLTQKRQRRHGRERAEAEA
jgi:hypothetical protein